MPFETISNALPVPGEAPSSRPAAPSRPARWRTVAVGLVLGLHLGWLGTHLWLVSEERINPWKLGGYGMYTVPFPAPLTHVYLFDTAARGWAELERGTFNSYAFDSANHDFVFRCRPLGAAALTAFLDENPHLRFRPLTLVVSEVQFSRAPVAAERMPVITAQLAWGGRSKFAFRGEACGTSFAGESDYLAPF